MTALLSLLFFGVAVLLTVVGSGMSLMYNFSALSYSEFEMSSQPQDWFGLWVAVYAYVPAVFCAFVSRLVQPVRGGRWILGGMMIATMLANLAVYIKSL